MSTHGAGSGVSVPLRRSPVELHEHEVPDLDVAIALGFGRSRGAAPYFRAVVVEDLRAWSARAGIGHLPEIVACVLGTLVVADPDAAFGRYADVLRPQLVRLVVVDVDGRPQPFGRQAVDLRQKLPREADRIALEIVAERPVAEHFEERMVARRVADIFEIVVLAARAEAALHRGCANVRPLLDAEKHVLELDHPGIREEQRRVVRGDERRRRHDRVAVLLEILEKPAAYFVGGHARGDRGREAAARQSY